MTMTMMDDKAFLGRRVTIHTYLPTSLYIAHDTPMHLFTTNDHLTRFNVDLEMGRREGALLSDTAALYVSLCPSQIVFPDKA